MDLLGADTLSVLWMAGGLALFMAWAIGANDVANAMGTSVGSGALTFLGAVLVAGVLEFSGAFLVGAHVTQTIRKEIIDPMALEGRPEVLAYGMLAALAAATTWLLIATRAGWPVSTTHSIVGAIVGFGVAALGLEAVEWGQVGRIVASWVVSPVVGAALAFGTFRLVQRTILDHERPVEQAKRIGPGFIFLVVFILALVTLFKGLKNMKLDFPLTQALALSAAIALLGAVVGAWVLRRIRLEATGEGSRDLASVERIFAVLQVMTAAAVAFAHGSNDVANSIGPLAAVYQVSTQGVVALEAAVPTWMLALGGIGIVIGLATYGYRVIETVGRRITELTPTRGFSAEFAAAATIVVASKAGIPVSTTHTLVGAVLGVGLARGIGALDLRVVGRIMVSWIATVPTGAVLAAFFFYFFKGLYAP
jgi:PiT family inorganic phosphate transporter